MSFDFSVRALSLLLSILGCACTGAKVSRVEDPRLPQLRSIGFRIAVVPFRASAPTDGLLTRSLGSVGEVLALEGGSNLPERDAVAAWMRRDVVAWLRQSEFEVVEPWASDTQLAHAGFDPSTMGDTGRAAEIARVLQVDGVVFGDVTRWNRSYYVVQSTAEVSLSLQLLDRSGVRLFGTERAETVGSGLSGGPTGYSSALSAPVQGLSGNVLADLTRSVARRAAMDLGGTSDDPARAQAAPRLSVVSLVRSKDGPVRAGEVVEVVAVGTPDCEVRFDIGRLRVGVPMQQTSLAPDARGDRAVYEGRYVVQETDPRASYPLFVTIARRGGRAQKNRCRWDGELRVEGSASPD